MVMLFRSMILPPLGYCTARTDRDEYAYIAERTVLRATLPRTRRMHCRHCDTICILSWSLFIVHYAVALVQNNANDEHGSLLEHIVRMARLNLAEQAIVTVHVFRRTWHLSASARASLCRTLPMLFESYTKRGGGLHIV